MSFANGRCLVTKEDGPCLVLPKGTFSSNRISYISKEGSEILLDVLKNSDDKVKGVCVINRQEYDNCVFIPRGIINPKLRFLMSSEAIEGMAAELSKMGSEEPVKEVPAPVVESLEEIPAESITVEEEPDEKAKRTAEDRRIKRDEPRPQNEE